MEKKDKRRKYVRRHQKIDVSIDKRKGTERRVMKRRSGFDRRKQKTNISINKRSAKDRRVIERLTGLQVFYGSRYLVNYLKVKLQRSTKISKIR